MSQHFQKGTDVRVATTAADEVALRYEDFIPVVVNAAAAATVTVATGVDYRELQAAAKALGIPANQSADELEVAIRTFEEDPDGYQFRDEA